MNLIFKTILSLSLSGALFILLLLFGGGILKKRLSRQWQYYIWLIVVMRLLLPFGPEETLLSADVPGGGLHGDIFVENEGAAFFDSQETKIDTTDREAVLGDRTFLAKGMPVAQNVFGMIWLAVAVGLLIRKISMYQSYIRYVKAGAEPVCEIALLDQLAVTVQKLGISRAVELCVNPLVASPMLVGYFHPCIVLPRADVSEKEFYYIAMHELTHYKRRDIVYKWLVQLAVCLHWFNPLVYVMRREIEKACEFACDEAVIGKAGYDSAADYGETLLNAMVSVAAYREPFAVTMSANAKLLKERLGAIMHYKKKTKRMQIITAGLTVVVALGVFYLGVYLVAAAEPDSVGSVLQFDRADASLTDRAKAIVEADKAEASEAEREKEAAFPATDKAQEANDGAWSDAEKYYKARSLPQFYMAFAKLDEKEQEIWMDRIYADDATQFFSACVLALDADSPLVVSFAEKFYGDGSIAFFSILAKVMDEETLEEWLNRALADEKWNFQSMLYQELGGDEETDALEKALEEEQMAQYRAVGVTQNGKNYYYEGQLVNIFLDVHMPNQSFYTLNMNPAGTVNIKIIRAEDGKITGAAYMTEAEVEELLSD